MIVHTSVKVGIARFLKPLCCFDNKGVFSCAYLSRVATAADSCGHQPADHRPTEWSREAAAATKSTQACCRFAAYGKSLSSKLLLAHETICCRSFAAKKHATSAKSNPHITVWVRLFKTPDVIFGHIVADRHGQLVDRQRIQWRQIGYLRVGDIQFFKPRERSQWR